MAIIDKDNPYIKVNAEQGSLIKKRLMKEQGKLILTAFSRQSRASTFKSWTYSGDIIRVICDDDGVLNWLTEVTKSLKLIEDAALAVVSLDKLPRLTKATLWVSEDGATSTSDDPESAADVEGATFEGVDIQVLHLPSRG